MTPENARHTGTQTSLEPAAMATRDVDVRAPLLIEGARTHTEPKEQKRGPSNPAAPLGISLPEFDRLLKQERTKRAVRRSLDLEENPPTAIPPAVSLKDRFARPRREVTYRIDDWFVAGGHVILVAQYKSGKTTLVGNLVRSLVDGDMFLGVAAVYSVESVVVLDFEMSESQIEGWLRDQNIRNTQRAHLVSLRGAAGSFDILDPHRRREWAARLQMVGAKFVVLDCLRPALDALGLDEHSEAGRWFTAFDSLLKEADVPEALVVHHSGHGGDRSRGDSRILDWPDGIWSLVRADRDDLNTPRFISAKGRDISVGEGHLEFDPFTRHLTYSPRSRKVVGADKVMLAVLREIVRAKNPMSIRAVHAALKGKGHTKSSIEAALAAGSDPQNGYLNRIADGPKGAYLHSVTPVGQAFLAASGDEL